MTVAIRTRDDVSVNDLKEIARSLPMVRTPHVGNNSPYNLFAAACGFPTVLVDTNTPGRDTTYHPHMLIRDGEATVLTECSDPMQTLVTHLSVTSGQGILQDPPCKSIVEVHLSRFKSVFPKTPIETHQEFLKRNRARVETALEIMTEIMPNAWYRRVSPEGILHVYGKEEPTGITRWSDIAHDVFIAPARSGWVIPNMYALILDIIVQMRDGSSPHIWMLSGPDLVRYMPKMQDELDLLYGALSRRLGLPSDVFVHIVPFADFRFVVRSEHRQRLDSLLLELDVEKVNRLKVGEAAVSCPDLWYRTERAKHFSQHDMSSAADIYVPDRLLEMSIRSCRELWLRIRGDVPKKLR